MAERTASRDFVHQLQEYLDQKPPREHPINRGHRIRDFTGGRLNRYIPLTKSSLGQHGDGALCGIKSDKNNVRFVTTAAIIYNASSADEHISADCRANVVVVNLPLAASAGTGKRIVVKESLGVAPIPFTVTVNAAAGETIDGAVGVVFAAAGQSLVVVSDGVTNWEVVA